ncbi:aminoglycoside phosphotransferase family protein [Kineosporia sp. R_H_3]|uniref:aminoglycoside phosphotransferase family protein n=1 Tax=Kineosporia sp. R_H_3 TaxID=1961848 RepID=UPI000B4BB1E1|nr:aminoglycoside phosphotransferase family protein [Kineosporia sp. R_H_3]
MTSPRRVTLVLCTGEHGVLGVLPPFEVGRPYWQETDGVVAGALERYDLHLTVLRILHASEQSPPGGDVTYLAEADPADAGRAGALVSAWSGPDPLADHPLRMPWARPGGPAADVGWALAVLAAAGRTPAGPPEQMRTWNLSSLWRLPATDGAGRAADAWLKVVPRFFAHEGLVLERLQRTGAVPALLARDTGPDGSGRVLLDAVPGEDFYGAPAERVAGFARTLARIQAGCAGDVDALAAAGVPDRRDPALLVAEATRLVDLVATGDGGAGQLAPAEVEAARRLVDALPDRLAREAACGVPESLVHGDFHPGNVRGAAGRWRVLDWGDSYLGSPAVDVVTAGNGLDAAGRQQVLEAAAAEYGPDVDLLGAADAARPVSPLRGALAWQRFLDAIEPDEWPYHEGDPAAGLRDALAAFH